MRVGHIGALVLERGKQGGVPRMIAILAILALLLLYVAGKVKIMQLGYQIDSLEQEKRELERENRSLRIEASSLLSSARIEEIATKRLGMVRPEKENIVIVKRKAPRTQ